VRDLIQRAFFARDSRFRLYLSVSGEVVQSSPEWERGRRFGQLRRAFLNGDRGPDVFALESRICIKQIVLGSAFRELPKNQFYFDPRPFDDRLSHHHFRVDFDSIGCHKIARFRPNR